MRSTAGGAVPMYLCPLSDMDGGIDGAAVPSKGNEHMDVWPLKGCKGVEAAIDDVMARAECPVPHPKMKVHMTRRRYVRFT